MEVIKIGGPVYRIGVGGGSASSIEVKKITLHFLHGSIKPKKIIISLGAR